MSNAKEIAEKITKAMEGVTPGSWDPCHHLKSPQHDASCNCGYRGGIWGNDGQWVIVEMGSSPDVDESGQIQGHTVPQADRATQLRDAGYIIAVQPDNMRVILDALALVPVDPWGWEIDGSYPLCGEDIITKSKEVRDSWAKNDGITIRPLYTSPTPHSSDRDELLEEARLLLIDVEEFVIDGITELKSQLEMNLPYPSRAERFQNRLDEARNIHASMKALYSKLEGSSHAKD